MSLAVFSIHSLGLKPKWCCCDVIQPSDLLSKHTAFSVSPLKTGLTLLISHANSALFFSSAECEEAATAPSLSLLMVDIIPSLCLLHVQPHCMPGLQSYSSKYGEKH